MQIRKDHAAPLDERYFVCALLDLDDIVRVMRVNSESNARARITVYLEFDEGGNAGNVNTARCEIPTRDGNRLDGLVDRTGANRLYTYGVPVLVRPAIAPGNRAGEDLLETFRKSMACP